jgi:hypothetical protein
MFRSAERSAARLAHQSGGLGVPSSNLGAPTTTVLQNNDKHLPLLAEHRPFANRLQICSLFMRQSKVHSCSVNGRRSGADTQ